jgi:high-affinity iron transporter
MKSSASTTSPQLRAASSPNRAAPVSAAALIVFREVLEAALIIGIVLAASRGVRGRGLIAAGGILTGALGAVVVAALAGTITEAASGVGQEILNAAILSAAVLMLGWHNVWMSRHGREMAARMKALGSSIAHGRIPAWVLGCAIALAVLREGSEVALFLYGIAAGGEKAGAMLLGSLIGLAAGALVGMLLYAGVLRIPVRHFFTVTGAMILLLSAGLSSQAAGFLVQAGLLPPLGESLWDTSWLLDEGSIVGQFLHILIGYISRPAGIQVLVYVLTLAIVGTLMATVGRTSSASARTS